MFSLRFNPRMVITVCLGFSLILLLLTPGHGVIDSSRAEEVLYVAELEVEGFSPLILSELPQVSIETEVVEISNEKDMIISKKPGKTRYNNIVIVVEMDSFPDSLRNWHQETIDGIFTKRWGTVTIKEKETGEVKIRYIFYEGWPSKLTYHATGGKYFVHYEIVVGKIEVRKFPIMPQ